MKMPLAQSGRIFSFPELRTSQTNVLDAFKGLPGLLADSLPDRYGNQLINVWLAQNGRPQNSMNPVEQFGESFGYGRVEMAYYHMAKACGIEMMPSRILEENGRAHFMTRRFDREGSDQKHHIQTFCAMQHFDFNDVRSFSYEQLFQTMRELRLSYPQAEQMFRRMVFNVLARNCDDHTKNFAFRLKKGGDWELAPAYDICHAYRPGSLWVSQQALSVNSKRQNILKEDLLSVARAINIKKANSIIYDISSTVSRWIDFADRVHVRPNLRDAISKTLITAVRGSDLQSASS